MKLKNQILLVRGLFLTIGIIFYLSTLVFFYNDLDLKEILYSFLYFLFLFLFLYLVSKYPSKEPGSIVYLLSGITLSFAIFCLLTILWIWHYSQTLSAQRVLVDLGGILIIFYIEPFAFVSGFGFGLYLISESKELNHERPFFKILYGGVYPLITSIPLSLFSTWMFSNSYPMFFIIWIMFIFPLLTLCSYLHSLVYFLIQFGVNFLSLKALNSK